MASQSLAKSFLQQWPEFAAPPFCVRVQCVCAASRIPTRRNRPAPRIPTRRNRHCCRCLLSPSLPATSCSGGVRQQPAPDVQHRRGNITVKPLKPPAQALPEVRTRSYTAERLQATCFVSVVCVCLCACLCWCVVVLTDLHASGATPSSSSATLPQDNS